MCGYCSNRFSSLFYRRFCSADSGFFSTGPASSAQLLRVGGFKPPMVGGGTSVCAARCVLYDTARIGVNTLAAAGTRCCQGAGDATHADARRDKLRAAVGSMRFPTCVRDDGKVQRARFHV